MEKNKYEVSIVFKFQHDRERSEVDEWTRKIIEGLNPDEQPHDYEVQWDSRRISTPITHHYYYLSFIYKQEFTNRVQALAWAGKIQDSMSEIAKGGPLSRFRIGVKKLNKKKE